MVGQRIWIRDQLLSLGSDVSSIKVEGWAALLGVPESVHLGRMGVCFFSTFPGRVRLISFPPAPDFTGQAQRAPTGFRSGLLVLLTNQFCSVGLP